ncbi:uncharacterized protein [Epargyreus clarus]|uniref:uncharacterized protein n=1 Tax=Epargyreus clarus TaxID=520877 RepID=UPI003C2BE4E4
MSGIKQVRNKKLLPDLRKEGELTKEIVLSTKEKHGVPTGSRLFSHHTLASVRKLHFFHPFFLPDDSLDLILAATYNHSTERFADKEDLYLQPETIGCDTWRRLRNTYDKLPPVVIPLGHPMKRGGIKERKSPFSVKLMNSGVHSSQTNPGYNKKSNRVRSWYLYEQYKSLEKNQLDAAKKLKNRSCQDRILHRELNERRARRRFSDNYSLRQSSSRIERNIKSDTTRTPFSESSDSFFESVSEQEDVVSGKGPEGTLSQHSKTSKFYDDFKSSNDKKDLNSPSDSITSVLEITDLNENIADDIKVELEFVKKNIAEIINLQLEAEKECLETCTELCNNDTNSDSESLNSLEDIETKSVKSVDKYYPKYDNGILAIWSKLVTFSYNLMQMNRGNCYYDFSSQFLTAVLAFDVLRRGINRMCHILQPYVSPIKYTNDESDASVDANDNFRQNQSQSKIRKSNKNINHKCRILKFEEKPSYCPRKYSSENRSQYYCKYSVQNRLNKMRTRGASEPWRSVAKFSGGRNSLKEKSSCNKFLDRFKKDNCSSNCKCRQLKQAIKPILRLSRYIDMILQELDD